MGNRVALKKKETADQPVHLKDRSEIFRKYFVFNFSFPTSNKKYSLVSLNEKNVHIKFTNKLHALSDNPVISIHQRSREDSFERIPEEEIKASILPVNFRNSGLMEECDSGYWVFRLNKLGRVLTKRHDNILYVIAVDTHFDLYNH